MNKAAPFNRSLLILKSHVQNLMGAETFLRKRDWRVFSTTNLKEALVYLIKSKPSFVMISTDFPHKKIEELSAVLTKIFPVCTIAFAENNTVTSYQFISEMGARYQLYPPVTGPAFERIVNKFTKDLELKGPLPVPPALPLSEAVLVDRILSQLSDEPLVDSLRKGTQTALDESVVRLPVPTPIQPLRQVSRVGCIVVQSANFSGYLLAASAKTQPMDELFLQNLKQRLYSFLQASGEEPREEEVFHLEIKEVSFVDLAEGKAEFLRRSVHYSEEVALAFFPTPRIAASFQESFREDLVAVDMKDIKADTVVDFNMYLYLPANKKSLLYTPKGSQLYAKQKDKLLNGGIQHLHVPKAELAAFNKYRALHFISDRIEEFESEGPRSSITAPAP